MEITVLIMAGGQGERFWPKSRANLPKQFLNILDKNKTMIQLTVERAEKITNIKNIYIITNEKYKYLVKQQINKLPEENIICEPASRNTAPCIGLAAMYISKKYDDSIMVVLPADHAIKDDKEFLSTLNIAKNKAIEDENLVTIGIKPNYPETGYGYIKYKKNENKNIFSVDKFVEKPNVAKAKQYLISGDYLWNSGMFIWKTSTIIKNIQKYLPETYDKLIKIRDSIGTEKEQEILIKEFVSINKESIDYGIMEKAEKIYTVPGYFGWDDVGSWSCLQRINEKDDENNVKLGNVLTLETKNCIVYGEKRLIATLGISDLIIIDTEDALLVSSRKDVGNVKEIINKIKETNKEEYI